MNTIIPTDRGYNLFAHVFHPEVKRTPQHVLIVNTAMGIGMEFYFPFARYIASVGFPVITYDYHTNQASSRSRHWHLNEAVVACGSTDFEAVILWTEHMFAGHSIHAIGHGIGGAIPGFSKSINKIKTLINIAVQAPTSPEIPKKHWLNFQAYNLYLKTRFFFSRSFLTLPSKTLLSPIRLAYYQHHLRLLSADVDINVLQWKSHLYFDAFTGRVLTTVVPDDVLFSPAATERIHFQFINAKKVTRFLYPEEFDMTQVGFFGFFTNNESPAHWEMIIHWITDTLPIREDKYAIFHDEELPILVIEISHRDPTLEMIEAYVETLKQYFERSPVYMIIDMSRVHWVNARFIKRVAEWVKQNRELIRTRHKGTAYACANPLIRYFISIIHAMDVFSVIKPVVVFKTVDQARKWARLRIEEQESQLEIKTK